MRSLSLTPTDPNQDEINEIIGLTERKIRDLMNILAIIVFNKIIDKTSGQFEAFFPCQNRLFFFGKTDDFLFRCSTFPERNGIDILLKESRLVFLLRLQIRNNSLFEQFY